METTRVACGVLKTSHCFFTCFSGCRFLSSIVLAAMFLPRTTSGFRQQAIGPNSGRAHPVLFTVGLLLTFTSAFQLSEEQAKSHLRSKRSFEVEEYVDSELKKQVGKIQNKWNSICKFDGVNRWEEFKDELEETKLPEKEVDANEKCIAKCNRKDNWADIRGNAYEEIVMEEGSLDKWYPACEDCFDVGLKTFKKINSFSFEKNCKPKRFN